MNFNELSNILGTQYWVMFFHGSIITLNNTDATYQDKATKLLQEYGPVRAGTPFGDMCPARSLDDTGERWLISYPHYDHIYNIVRFKEGVEDTKDISVNITLIGRRNRAKDAEKPFIIIDSLAKLNIKA